MSDENKVTKVSLEDYYNNRLEKEKENTNRAYAERNRLVALVAKMALDNGWRAGISVTEVEGWPKDWQNCVYIDTPFGQLSWHYHTKEQEIFDFLPWYSGDWDGHSTEEKYSKIERYTKGELDVS